MTFPLYARQLLDTVLVAGSALLQAFAAEDRRSILKPHLDFLLSLCEFTSKQTFREPTFSTLQEKVIGSAIGVLGDIACSYGHDVTTPQSVVWMNALLGRASTCSDPSVKEVLDWTQATLKSLENES